jgi:hypothetical protein
MLIGNFAPKIEDNYIWCPVEVVNYIMKVIWIINSSKR